MLNYNYPPLEAFLPPGWKPPEVTKDMAAVRAGIGKKKRTPKEPECYGTNCGAKSRDSLAKLHELKP